MKFPCGRSRNERFKAPTALCGRKQSGTVHRNDAPLHTVTSMRRFFCIFPHAAFFGGRGCPCFETSAGVCTIQGGGFAACFRKAALR